MKFLNTALKIFSLLIAPILLLGILSTTTSHAQVNGLDYAVVLDTFKNPDDPSGVQKVKVEIKTGQYNHSTFDISFKAPTENIKRELVNGDIVLVKFVVSPENQKIQTVEIVEFYRVPSIFWAPALFILVFLIVVIVKYKRKVLIFLGTLLAVALSMAVIVFIKISAIPVIIVFFSIMFFSLLFLIYRKFTISLVGFFIPIILGVTAFILAFITVQITQVQLAYIGVVASFYGISNYDFFEPFYLAVVMSSVVGGVYIAYQQILESIKIKISNIEISKRELTLKSFRHMIKTFDTIIFPTLGFMLGIILSLMLFLQRSFGFEAALNNDYWVAFTVICSISLIIWAITVPVTALLCGVILGRLEKHKIVTDKTISILD